MNVRKFWLLSLVVLLVCQFGFAQVIANKTIAKQSFAKAQATGKPTPLLAKPLPGTKARPVIWVTGQKWQKSVGPAPKNVPGEPSFCDYNNGHQAAICPKGLQTAYGTNFPGANGGAGMTIVVLDYFSYPGAYAQLQFFDVVMHLPDPPSFKSIDLSGGNDGTGTGWDLETMLDLEYSHAMAPNANIVYIQADPNGDGSYEEQLAQSLGDVVSNSWTFTDQNGVGVELPYWEANLGFGPPTLFAAGDGSAFPYEGPAYPCTSPQATCVGGTSLYLKPNLTRNIEEGWSGSGGGCSQVFAIPAWQGSVGSGVCAPYRAAPDIAAIADGNTPVAVWICNAYWGCYFYGVGGTSVATPVLSGLVADMDTARVIFGKGKLNHLMNYELYPAAAYNYNYYYYDVIYGFNGYNAGPQYDLITGIGVPSGKALASRFFGIP